MVRTELVKNYKNFGRCLHLENDIIELYVTIDVGPRIIHMSYIGEENLFFTDLDRKYKSLAPERIKQVYGEESEYFFYGGHRVWLSPQDGAFTNPPDNDEVQYSTTINGAIFFQNKQWDIGVALTMEIIMDKNNPEFSVRASYQNISMNPKFFSVWQLSQMVPGGLEIFPLSTQNFGTIDFDRYFFPDRTISFYPFTDINDPRLIIDNNYASLKQDSKNNNQFKMASVNRNGWSMYAVNDIVIILRYNHIPGENYPDGGSSFATYTNSDFLELETMGVWKLIPPGVSTTNIQNFIIRKTNMSIPDPSERSAIAKFVTVHL